MRDHTGRDLSKLTVAELQVRRQRVAELKAQVRNGTYQPNLRVIAERMLATR